jgi:hypothetical protein
MALPAFSLQLMFIKGERNELGSRRGGQMTELDAERVHFPGREASMSRVLTYLLAAVACIVIASTIAWSNFVGSAGAPAYVTKADFDRAFADAAAGRRESKPTIRDEVDGSARSSGGATTKVNRERKSDRLPVLGSAGAAAPSSTSNTIVVRKNAASAEPAERYASATKGLRDRRCDAGREAGTCATLRASGESVCRSRFKPDHRALFRVNWSWTTS